MLKIYDLKKLLFTLLILILNYLVGNTTMPIFYIGHIAA